MTEAILLDKYGLQSNLLLEKVKMLYVHVGPTSNQTCCDRSNYKLL